MNNKTTKYLPALSPKSNLMPDIEFAGNKYL